MHVGDTIFIFCLALIIFGPKKLPEIGRQIGKLMVEFRRASNDFKMQIDEELRASEQAERQKEISATPAVAAMTAAASSSVEPTGETVPVIAPPMTGLPVNHTFPAGEFSLPPAEESVANNFPEPADSFNTGLNTASNGAIAETPVAEPISFPTEIFPPAELKAEVSELEAEKAQAPLQHG